MKDNTYANCVKNNFLNNWNTVAELKKPIIAAVNGYAVRYILQIALVFSLNI